jgi:lipopolysaccharide biosynthesis glycosyltransferase
MSSKPLWELVEAAARTATGSGNPLTRNKRKAETLQERVATLQGQRDRLVKERDAARSQVEKLRKKAEVLREQRDRGRAASSSLAILGRLLGLENDASGRQLRQALNQLRGEAQIAQGLLRGDDLDAAAVTAVRALLANPQSISRARALCAALQADERTRMGGAVALGHYLLVWGSRRTAHEQFADVPLDLIVRTAAVAAVTSAWHVDPAAGERLTGEVLAHPDLRAGEAFDLAGHLAGRQRTDLARHALARVRTGPDLDDAIAAEAARLTDWLDSHAPELDTVAPARTRPVFGVLHFQQPRWTLSSNDVADYVQSLAAIGALLRRPGVRMHADDELQKTLDTLRAEPPDTRAGTAATDVDFVPLSRDASRWEVLPDPTWLIASGWWLCPIFGVRTDLPLHPAIRPVFVSFTLGRPEVLTPHAVEYLRRHGPVGCRDWTTVDLLLSYGVEAFFSGDLTTTLGALLGARRTPDTPDDGTRDPQAAPRHAGDLRAGSLATNLLTAAGHLRAIRDVPGSLRTADLTEYLAAVGMGVPTFFEPANASDPRLEGLDGLAPGSPELTAMQERLTGLVDAVLDLVLSGSAEEEVYGAWRRRVAPLVQEARARREAWRNTVPAVESLANAAAPVRESAAHLGEGGDVHVAIALDRNLVDAAPVALQGIDENTSREVRVHVMTRGIAPETVQTWARTFPRLRFSHYRFDEVEYGSIARLLSHTTVSTMDRLLLPDVLADLARVVYIDIDVAVLGDVGELWDLNLGGAPLSARPTASEWAESGLAFIYRAALRLPVEVAREFRVFMHARLEGDFVSFNAGILVLDLARMRADGFTEHFAGMAGRYGLNDQDVLWCYAASKALALDPRWNCFPTREPVPADARLVHYAGGTKPWQSLPLPAKDLWESAQRRYAARAGEVP